MLQRELTLESIEIAREVFSAEAEAINTVAASIDESFDKAVELIAAIKGKVVVSGIGKSGHVGAKLAATLASTGTPAFFAHPAEMGHGDLGMLGPDDLVIAISFSGRTEELRKILTPIKRMDIPLISITGNQDSILSKFSDVVLLTPITREACPLDLAPTSSTTVALVMGDALAIALMRKRNFQVNDFAKSHPLGTLGKSLVLVAELMRKDQAVPTVAYDTPLDEILQEIDTKKLGLTTVVSSEKKLLGVITDGDLRRAQIKYGVEIFNKLAKDIMAVSPKTINRNAAAISAVKAMEQYRISDLVVVDDLDRPIGIIDLKDLLEAGLL